MMSLSPGARLGPYEIVAAIGALKVLPEALAALRPTAAAR
jgi:hypothetical protein